MTTTTDFKCAVRADLFARAMLAISTEDTRYYLNGVFVTKAQEGGAMLVATNGHWLVAIRDPRGLVEGSAIVKLDAAMKKSLAFKRDDISRSVHGHGGERVLIASNKTEERVATAMVVVGGRIYTPKGGEPVDPRADTLANLTNPSRSVVATQFDGVLIDGTFPDFRRVIPDDADFTLRIPTIDVRLIEKASMALANPLTQSRAVIMGPSKSAVDSGPVTVLSAYKQTDDHEALAVIMPIRNDNPNPEVPTFWKAAQ